jgi:5-hydroxyisourate hydrolase-like protein (transthyretin family)
MRLAGLVFVFFAALVPTIQTPQDPANGSIEGIVVNATTNLPIEGVRLRIGPRPGSPYQPSDYPDVSAVRTGPDGKFTFTGLKAALYGVIVEENGYVKQGIGFSRYGSELQDGPPIALIPGQAVKGITVRMVPAGTVSGRIRDADLRQPVAGVRVQLLRLDYGADGQRTLGEVDSVRTNDRGEYRLYFVTPGRYYIGAGGVLPRNTPGTLQNNPNLIPADYAATFYPGVTNTWSATMVDVKPGANVAGIDFSVSKHVLYRISGRVLDSATGQPPAAATFSLYRRSDLRWESVEGVNNYRPADGTFRLTGLVPGSYSIVVSARKSAPRSIQAIPSVPAGPRVISVAFRVAQSRDAVDPPGYARRVTAVEITGSDVEGLTIPVSPGVLVDGRVTIEGRAMPAASLDRVQVSVRSPDKLLSNSSRLGTTGTPGAGTLRFDDVAPGEYRVSVSGLPEGFYVKQVNFGGIDGLQGLLQISPRDSNRLNVIISPNVAALEGIVRNDRMDTVPGSAVVLIPDRRDRTELFQRVTTDREGRFIFASVAPGAYKVFAWEALESYAYFDAEFMRQAEQRGKAIQLTESDKQGLDVRIIPKN